MRGGSKTHGGFTPMNDPQRVAVVGATGYAGFELAQLLFGIPKFKNRPLLAGEFGAREVPDGNFPATAWMGRSSLQDIFR